MTDMERRIEAAIIDFCRLWVLNIDMGHICDDGGNRIVSISDLTTHIADELGRKP